MYGGGMMMQPQVGMPMMMQQQVAMPTIMAAPSPSVIPPGTPPGLEFLIPTNQIMIQQQTEWGEILTGIHQNNRYHILDAWGRRMYFAGEDSDICNLMCCGNSRSWNINIYDCMGRAVMQGHRDSTACTCCGNACQVMSTIGIPLGSVVENCGLCSASWTIMDGAGAPQLLLKGPDCSIFCPSWATCCQAEFPLVTLDGSQQIGKVTKYYGGYAREMYTAADTFGVEFPPDLDPKIKAVLIYATFLIDFMYYENVGDNQQHHHHHHW